MFKHKFVVLLVSLFLFLGTGVFLEAGESLLREIVLTVLFAGLLASALFAVTQRRGHLVIFRFLVVLIIGFKAATFFFSDYTRTVLETLSHLAGMLFLIFCSSLILVHLFRARTVTVDTIAASLCVYLLLGAVFSGAFSALATFQEGAFSRDLSFLTDQPQESIYFSLVTLTTLGYGDITPKSSAAQMLAALEAVIGQVYIAVLVARLVGMHVAQTLMAEAPSDRP